MIIQNGKSEVVGLPSSHARERLLRAVPVMVLLLMILVPVGALYLYYPVSEWLSYHTYRPRFDARYEKEILPGVAWVRQYLEMHGRLPSQEEYRASQQKSDGYVGTSLMTAADQRPSWGIKGNNFMIAAHEGGEWNLYYQSWDDKRFWHYTE